MRYLLVLGFACDVYRREPRARIFVGDRLLDEFSIPNTPINLRTAQKEFHKKLHPLHPFSWVDLINFWIKISPPLKFYEIQVDDEISNLSIRIDIDNHDSNYNNGYMTRSTLIRLEVCAFFPLDQRLLQRLKKIRDRRLSENYAPYHVGKNRVFDLVQNGMCWKGVDGKKIAATPFTALMQENIGGDGAYVCELTKKYGIFMPTLARAYRYNFHSLNINYYFDKYFHHAHQRNNN